MKISLRYVITVVFFLLATKVVAASPESDLGGLLDSVDTMRAGFTQTVYDNRGNAVQRSYGKMSMERPGRFRWEVQKPIPQVIIANETRLWIYDPDLQQVTIRALKQAAGETPALLLSHVETVIAKDYTVKEVQKKAPGRWFSLIPKKGENMFASIEMGFLHDQIHEMQLQDHLGHMTKIQFQHAEVNMDLSPSLFTFKAPANVDVIDETHKK